MPTHKTESMCLKYADIDKEMVPIIAWLNSYDGIHTLFCCEGEKENEAFVIFTCLHQSDLDDVIKTIKDFTWNKEYSFAHSWNENFRSVDIYIKIGVSHKNTIRYTLKMSHRNVKPFSKYLSDQCIDIEYE